MISKDYYKDTYDDIHVSAELLEKLENAGERKKSGKKQWRFAVAAVAAIFIICGAVNHEKVLSFARSFFGTIVLSGKKEQMNFGDIQIIPIHQEQFIADKDTHKRDGMESYSHDFASYKEMNELSGIVLPGADVVTYKDISVTLTPDEELREGGITAEVIYGDIQFHMVGTFALEGYDRDFFGIMTSRTIAEEFEYGKGKKAYYLKKEEVTDGETDGVIYFEENGILFMLNFDYDGDEETQKMQAKELLSLFAD